MIGVSDDQGKASGRSSTGGGGGKRRRGRGGTSRGR